MRFPQDSFGDFIALSTAPFAWLLPARADRLWIKPQSLIIVLNMEELFSFDRLDVSQ